jgi:hypothetical protein
MNLAADYYQQLVEVAAKADTERPQLTHAKQFLAGSSEIES